MGGLGGLENQVRSEAELIRQVRQRKRLNPNTQAVALAYGERMWQQVEAGTYRSSLEPGFHMKRLFRTRYCANPCAKRSAKLGLKPR